MIGLVYRAQYIRKRGKKVAKNGGKMAMAMAMLPESGKMIYSHECILIPKICANLAPART